MATFILQLGPTPLGAWNCDRGDVAFHPNALLQDGVLLLAETESYAFILDPADGDLEYQVFIGDMPLAKLLPASDDADGVVLGGRRYWREYPYFESARGRTQVTVKVRPAASREEWNTLITLDLYVLPTKLGEIRYQRMTDDLETLGRGLLVDLYGKSTQTVDVRFSREGKVYHSSEQELNAIERVLEQLAEILSAVAQRPASRIRTVACLQRVESGERLAPEAIRMLAQHGVSPLALDRPMIIHTRRKVESFDVPEHRVIQAFLKLLLNRIDHCRATAFRHIHTITAEQHLRDVHLGDGPTLFEAIDVPMIKRLREAAARASGSAAMTTALCELPFLRDVPAEFVSVRDGAFQRSLEYRLLLHMIRGFLLRHAVWYTGDETAVVSKLTSRIFEQWCYLKIVEAFRACGVDLREWSDVLRQNLRTRFILDFERGLMFEGALNADVRLRFRYEPWIMSADTAARAGETLCRGGGANVAWCPDIVIECLRREAEDWRPVYGIVLDCKYTARITHRHWSDTVKYLEIRSTATRRQVVRQLWLIAPGESSGIHSEDPAVRFDENGPSCTADEAVRFSLSAIPALEENQLSGISDDDPFTRFARGTIAYLKREMGAVRLQQAAVDS